MSTDFYSSLSIIGVEAVATALSGLVYTTIQSEATDLLALAQIDEFLEDPSFPLTGHDRRFALSYILVQYIRQRLRQLCGIFELISPVEDEPYHKAVVTIGEFAKTYNPELIGWCWLYYRYVRVELDIQAQAFSKLCHINERTLRRYQAHAIKRLTDMLIQAEWQARRQHHFDPT